MNGDNIEIELTPNSYFITQNGERVAHRKTCIEATAAAMRLKFLSKREEHHRDRRAGQREILGQLKEAL